MPDLDEVMGMLAPMANGDKLSPMPRNPAAPADWAQNSVRNVAGILANIVMAPKRAMDHGFTTEEAVPWAADTAMTLAGLGSPMAAPGAAGIFGGRLAQTADHAALASAEKMLQKGASPDKIWNKTGWFQGADGKWRFEIPDFKAQVTDAPLAYGKGSTAGAKLSHPDLYGAYPDIAHTSVSTGGPMAPGAAGEYSHGYGEHGLVSLSPETVGSPNMRSVMLHELQHAVQRREGFDPGIAPANSSESAMTAYRNNAGEVEARNVQMRADRAWPRPAGDRPNVSATIAGHNFEGTEKQYEAIKEARKSGATPEQIADMINAIRSKIPPWRTESVARELQTLNPAFIVNK